MNEIQCSIFRSSKKEGMYLYVEQGACLDELPEGLMSQFGVASHVMDLLLTPARQLARADVVQVISSIADKGYYLQLPPLESQP